MNRALAAIFLAAALLSGCAAQEGTPPTDSAHETISTDSHPQPQPPADPVVATVRGEQITLSELQKPLIEAHGLNMLLELVELHLAQQDAQQQEISVSDQDVSDEITRTLIAFRKATTQDMAATQPSTEPSDDTLSAEDHDRLLSTLLTSQHLSEVEFNLVMRCNAYARKLVDPQAKAQLTPENIENHFNALYGEKARVRYIRLANMLEVGKVKNDLQAGKTFQEEMSLHTYDAMGHLAVGEPVPFSRKDLNFPTEFKEVAFGLKPDEVSDALQVKDSIFLIQLIEFIPPQHANFDEYKDWVRQDLYTMAVQDFMKQYIGNLGAVAIKSMEIHDPTLRAQWDSRLHNADEMRQQLLKQQQADTTQPAAEAAPSFPPATAGAAAAPAPAPVNQ